MTVTAQSRLRSPSSWRTVMTVSPMNSAGRSSPSTVKAFVPARLSSNVMTPLLRVGRRLSVARGVTRNLAMTP
jgi:hypothetical protein